MCDQVGKVVVFADDCLPNLDEDTDYDDEEYEDADEEEYDNDDEDDDDDDDNDDEEDDDEEDDDEDDDEGENGSGSSGWVTDEDDGNEAAVAEQPVARGRAHQGDVTTRGTDAMEVDGSSLAGGGPPARHRGHGQQHRQQQAAAAGAGGHGHASQPPRSGSQGGLWGLAASTR